MPDAERCPTLSQPLPKPIDAVRQLPLGFVLHWHEKGRDAYVASKAPSVLVNLFCWRMRDQEQQLVDFKGAEEWLNYLYETGLTSAVIIDTSIHHTSIGWRSQATKQLGENVRNPNGEQTIYSSPLSPRYREMVQQYVQDLTCWINKNDPEHRVTTYVNGAEVFWPGILDFGPLAAKAFREWLLEEYGSLGAVNDRWGATYSNIEDVSPLPFYRFGHGEFGPRTFMYGDWDDGAWHSSINNLRPGSMYRFNVQVKAKDILGDMCALLVQWEDDQGKVHVDALATSGDTKGLWKVLSGEAKAPEWAIRGTLLLVQKGPGKVFWRRPSIRDGEGDESILSVHEAWATTVWHGKIDFDSMELDGEQVMVSSSPPTEFPVKYPSAAWYDFQTFSMEIFAENMEHWSKAIRSCDPSRKIMHYAGFLLGTLSQWDDLSLTQRPDIFLSNAPSVDINGLQLCAGKGDFHYTTVVLDMARKYGKPMVATDLQDFTHGVYVGFNSLNRTTLAAVAHGLDGAYYYCWYGTPDYNWHLGWPPEDTARMIRNASDAIEFLGDSSIQTKVAMMVPIQPFCEADQDGRKSDMLDNMGWYKVLSQANIGAFDVFTPYELAKGTEIEKYKLIVLPDCPSLPVKVIDRLVKYVEEGGHLALAGRPPYLDETNRELKPGLIPLNMAIAENASEVTLVDVNGNWPGIITESRGRGTIIWTGKMDGRRYLGPVRRTRVAGNTPPLYLPDGDWSWPRKEGLYLLPHIRQWTKNADAVSDIVLEPSDPKLEYAVYKKDDEYRVIIIHTGDGMHWKGKITFPVREGEPEVLADFDPRPAKITRTELNSSVDLPAFSDCCLIRW